MNLNIKKPDLFTIIIIVSSLVFFSIAIYLIRTLSSLGIITLPQLPSLGGERLHSDIIYLTPKISDLRNARIIQISGNTIEVEATFSELSEPDNQSEKKLRFSLEVPDTLKITKYTNNIPSPFDTLNRDTSVVISPAELEINDILNIDTDSDLRLLSGKITATRIVVTTRPNAITGRISSINGNTIIVISSGVFSTGISPPLFLDFQPSEYSINITPSTEITSYVNNIPTILSLNDLSIGSEITAYALVDLTATSVFEAAAISVQLINTETSDPNTIDPPPVVL